MMMTFKGTFALGYCFSLLISPMMIDVTVEMTSSFLHLLDLWITEQVQVQHTRKSLANDFVILVLYSVPVGNIFSST